MARRIRIEYEGALYHVLCRGKGGQAIYRNDTDLEIFLKTLEECTEQTGWRIHEMKASDIRKQSLAWLLKKKTIVTGVWIAERLRMGHRVNVSRGVSRIQRSQDREIDALKKKLLQCTG